MAIRKPTPPKTVKSRLDSLRFDALSSARLAEDAGDQASTVAALLGIADDIDDLENALELEDHHDGHPMAKRIAELHDKAPAKKPRRKPKTWLRELATDESCVSKWSDAYVRRLGALEHCDEVLALHRAEAIAKAEGRKGTYASAIGHELADLWCILEMNRQADQTFARLCAERAWKFRP